MKSIRKKLYSLTNMIPILTRKIGKATYYFKYRIYNPESRRKYISRRTEHFWPLYGLSGNYSTRGGVSGRSAIHRPETLTTARKSETQYPKGISNRNIHDSRITMKQPMLWNLFRFIKQKCSWTVNIHNYASLLFIFNFSVRPQRFLISNANTNLII